MTKIRIGINGAAGRMGHRLIALTVADNDLELTATLEIAEHPQIGKDAGEIAGIGTIGITLTTELTKNIDVLIDFSSHKGTDALLRRCAELHIPLVFATTGLSPEQTARLRQTAAKIPVLWSPSMSMTVNLAMKLCESAAQVLTGKDADVESGLARYIQIYKDAVACPDHPRNRMVLLYSTLKYFHKELGLDSTTE
jgi:4-hydroxy-tetrahydrodipicolinate reductase